MKAYWRALHAFLAFTSSAVVWLLCIAAPILAALAILFVVVILLALWGAIVSGPVTDATIAVVSHAVILLATLALGPTTSAAVLRLSLRISPLPIGRPASSRPAPTVFLSWLLIVAALLASGSEGITLLVAGVTGAWGMARVYRFTRRWRGRPRGPTVLFLRRFGRSADRLVSTAVRRAVPEGASLVFLVGRRQSAASWDPLVVAFDGLRRGGLPLYLQSTDDHWITDVTQMTLQAQAVVLDATDWSEAMDTELGIVDACGASDRLTVLLRHDCPDDEAVRLRPRLRYRASWRQAGHRVFWGLMFTLVPAAVGDSAGWSPRTQVLLTLPAVVAWLLLVVRPLMDEAATRDLARRLAGRAGTAGRAAGPPQGTAGPRR
jgi:hypothetical protein